MRRTLILIGFFTTLPALLAFSLLFYSYLDYHKNPNGFSAHLFAPRQTVMYAALPTSQSIYREEIVEEDARVELVRQFFSQHASPLLPYAQDVIESADKYDLDFRLIPAIAMQESNLCKKIITGSNNCWGFGIYGGKVTRFKDYAEGIEVVTKTLAKNYKSAGLDTPDEIMKKYTPSNNGAWAYSVNYFMEQLQ